MYCITPSLKQTTQSAVNCDFVTQKISDMTLASQYAQTARETDTILIFYAAQLQTLLGKAYPLGRAQPLTRPLSVTIRIPPAPNCVVCGFTPEEQ